MRNLKENSSNRRIDEQLVLSDEDKLKNLKAKLSDDLVRDLPDSSLSVLAATSINELTIARDVSITAINKVMSNRIPAADVENAKKRLEEELRYTSLSTNIKKLPLLLAGMPLFKMSSMTRRRREN